MRFVDFKMESLKRQKLSSWKQWEWKKWMTSSEERKFKKKKKKEGRILWCCVRASHGSSKCELSFPTSHWLRDTVVSINPNIDPESDKWTGSDGGADKGWCYRPLTSHTAPSAHKPFVLAPETTGWGVKRKDRKGERDNKIGEGILKGWNASQQSAQIPNFTVGGGV